MSNTDPAYEKLGLDRRTLENSFPENFPLTIASIRRGFPFTTVKQVAEDCQISETQVATYFLGISEPNLSALKKSEQPLNPIQSDRLYRLSRLISRAVEVFENIDTARKWLKRPNQALGGIVPLDILDTDAGTEQVEELLNRIEYGVYS
jgi:putative toxin-antitoxin system antitoxin component (TIGR02293 family)